MMAVMTRRKPRIINNEKIIEAIMELPNPIYDKKHDLYIFIEGNARSNQTRVEHIAEYNHDLKVRDIKQIPQIISGYYFSYKKDPFKKDTFNYYALRKGRDKGFVKISIQIDASNRKRAWIKTVYTTYLIK